MFGTHVGRTGVVSCVALASFALMRRQPALDATRGQFFPRYSVEVSSTGALDGAVVTVWWRYAGHAARSVASCGTVRGGARLCGRRQPYRRIQSEADSGDVFGGCICPGGADLRKEVCDCVSRGRLACGRWDPASKPT